MRNDDLQQHARQTQRPALSLAAFVDRREQVDQFEETLDRIRQKRPVPSTLFEWHGGPGIGKTTLIRFLRATCDEQKVPSILVDFLATGGHARRYVADPAALIEDMTADLAKKAAVDAGRLREKIAAYRALPRPEAVVPACIKMSQEERLYSSPEWYLALQVATQQFLDLVGRLSPAQDGQPQPVAIFFDETERVDVELADWIEEWLINPLAQMGHCVIIWTARRPWRWKRPEIRRRLHSEALTVFKEDEVKQQVVQSGSAGASLAEVLFQSVHHVTGGHPYANAVVIEQLDAWNKAGLTPTAEYFSAHRADVLREVFIGFIRGYALREFTPRVQIACELLAMVRLFDTTMLRAVLEAHGGELFKGWSQEDFGDLLLQLKRTQLLVWGKGFALDPSLRHIIHNYFLVCEPDMYRAVNRTALEVYQTWLDKPVDNRGLFVIEELYHEACLNRVGEQIAIEETFKARLSQYPVWITDQQALRSALEWLKEELAHDEQLGRLTDDPSNATLRALIEAMQ
ncbi:MAG: ATP-binding protein [Anaerolineae bacterium]|nr:ATP-binding protein [Anaerolineae bacterium]